MYYSAFFREKFAKFANFWKSFSIFASGKIGQMDIQFEKEYLRELYYEGKTSDKKHRYQPQVIKKYVRVLNILDSVESTEDLYRYVSLHYEKLTGDKAGLESVRVNDQYRIEFISSLDTSKAITICNIIELSNHYK